MAKKKIVEKSLEELDAEMEVDYQAAKKKLPTDSSRGRMVLQDYMTIPCDQIIPYSGKVEGEDFHSMSNDEFQRLVESIKEVGVIESISVRPAKQDNQLFEVLAGEHRWRASICAGFTEIRCRVYWDIDDKKANLIYNVTNLLRREMLFSDLCNGWHSVWESTKKQGLRTDLDETLKEERDFGLSIRQVQRYVKMYSLLPQLKMAVNNGKMNQRIAYTVSFLSKQQQEDILDSIHLLTEEKAQLLRAMSEENDWSIDMVRDVLMGKKSSPRPFTVSMSNIRKFAKSNIRTEDLHRVDKIFEEAMDLYFEKHPEIRKK